MRDMMLLTADWERVASVSLPAGELPECVVYAGKVYVRRLGVACTPDGQIADDGKRQGKVRRPDHRSAYQEALCVWTEGSEG